MKILIALGLALALMSPAQASECKASLQQMETAAKVNNLKTTAFEGLRLKAFLEALQAMSPGADLEEDTTRVTFYNYPGEAPVGMVAEDNGTCVTYAQELSSDAMTAIAIKVLQSVTAN